MEEKENNKNRKSNNNHLRDLFSRNFTILFFLGNFATIIITIIILNYLLKQVGKNNQINETFSILNYRQTIPLLFEAEQLVLSSYQEYFNYLKKIEIYAESVFDISKDDSSSESDFIIDYDDKNKLKKLEELNLSYEYTKEFIKYFLHYGIYKKNKDFNKEGKKFLNLFDNLIPILETIYNITNYKTNILNKIYIIIDDFNLFFQYPFQDNISYLTDIPSWCINSFNTNYFIGNNFDYHCTNWYMEIKHMINLNSSNNLGISSPFINSLNAQQNYCVIICYYSQLIPNNTYFCFEILTDELERKLNLVNSRTNGFFYISRICDKNLFYYPRTNDELKKTIELYEFSMNKSYYYDELIDFQNISKVIYKQYTKNEKENVSMPYSYSLKYNYKYNNKVWIMYILPIFFQDYEDDSSSNKENLTFSLLNLIYIEEENHSRNFIDNLLSWDIGSIIIPIIFTILQGLLLHLLSTYLIRAIEKNIVYPIKNIKKSIERMNDETEDFYINNNLATNKNLLLSENNFESYNNLINEKEELNYSQGDFDNNENNLYNNNNDDYDEEEEYINLCSQDIKNIFCKFINVRNSLSTVSNTNKEENLKNIPEMLFATEVFEQINNKPALKISNSNIGYLLLQCKKYDIAILHLIESVTFIDEESDKKYFKFLQNEFNTNQYNNQINNQKESIFNNELLFNIDNKTILESRFPKLIFCYKKLFFYLKKLKKLNINKDNFENSKQDLELYLSNNKHLLTNYLNVLDKNIILAHAKSEFISSKTKLIIAYFEKIECYINFLINQENTNIQIFKELYEMFINTKNLIKINKNDIKPKSILKNLLKEKNLDENLIEIPNEILLQKLYFFKGLLSYKCKNYIIAIKYFSKTLEKNFKISDAKIVFKSNKKLIKIANLYYNKYDILKKNKEKLILNEYINNKENELNKFNIINNDIGIIISVKNSFDFIKLSIEKIIFIIENYIDDEDRFFIAFSCEDSLKILINLDYKKNIFKSYILEYFKNLENEYITNSLENGEDNLTNIIKKSKIYLIKKNIEQKRNNVIMFMTNRKNIQNYESKNFLENELKNILIEKEDKLLIITQDFKSKKNNNNIISNEINENNQINNIIDNENIEFNSKKINKKICKFINFDNLSEIKNVLMRYGKIKDQDFALEKYI